MDKCDVLHLFQQVGSADQALRDDCCLTLQQVYRDFPLHRTYIRVSIRHIFLSIIFETDAYAYEGIAELLLIMEVVVEGLRLPLKAEYKVCAVSLTSRISSGHCMQSCIISSSLLPMDNRGALA